MYPRYNKIGRQCLKWEGEKWRMEGERNKWKSKIKKKEHQTETAEIKLL